MITNNESVFKEEKSGRGFPIIILLVILFFTGTSLIIGLGVGIFLFFKLSGFEKIELDPKMSNSELEKEVGNKEFADYLSNFQPVKLPLTFKSKNIEFSDWPEVQEEYKKYIVEDSSGLFGSLTNGYTNIEQGEPEITIDSDSSLELDEETTEKLKEAIEEGIDEANKKSLEKLNGISLQDGASQNSDTIEVKDPRYFYGPFINDDYVAFMYLTKTYNDSSEAQIGNLFRNAKVKSTNVVLSTFNKSGEHIESMKIAGAEIFYTDDSDTFEEYSFTTIDSNYEIEIKKKSVNNYDGTIGATNGWQISGNYQILDNGKIEEKVEKIERDE